MAFLTTAGGLASTTLQSRVVSYPAEHDVHDQPSSFDINEWIDAMWARFDRDNNGYISREELDCEEFHNMLRAVLAPEVGPGMGGPSYARAQVDMDQAISFCLRKADLNADQVLSFDEFKAFALCLRNPQLSLHTANLIFALFDTNRDQMVDEYEFREIYRFYTGRTPTLEEFKAEWRRLDVNREGRVDREAYCRWLQMSPNPVFRLHAPLTSNDLLGLGGSTDLHSGSSRSGSITVKEVNEQPRWEAKSQPRESTATKPWRPWHPYEHFAWNQVGLKAAKQELSKTTSAPREAKKSSSQAALSKTDSDMPRWNQRLATANMNWISEVSGKPKRHKYNRTYFSRYQSLPDLHHHYRTNEGFEDQLRRLEQPERVNPKRNFVPSHENTQTAGPELLPNRRFAIGRARNPKTGKREKWKDNFLTPPQLRDQYQPSTIAYRCPGAPPRYMYADEYYDD